MRSTSTAQAASTARQVADSLAARMPARAGPAARGVIYILVGWIAILVAIGLVVFGVYGLYEARWRRV